MDRLNYRIYHSKETDTRINLALEEYFLSEVKDKELIVFFWQSENSVVIGKNQNPYQECNIEKLEKENVVMVRRLSGGGAVYHDLGNLNFAFIAKSESYNIDRQFSIMLESLEKLGVKGEFNGRNDLIALGRKFSGNAFINEDDRHLHHGTLLIKSDITKIANYLSVSHKKLDNKGFDSVKSRVINLSEINKDITVDSIIDSTIKTINQKENSDLLVEKISQDTFIINNFLEKYKSHKWNYGDCPEFDIKFDEKFPWGLLTVEMSIDEGAIKEIALYTDALQSEKFDFLKEKLEKNELTMEKVNQAVDEIDFEENIRNNLKDFFEGHLFK